MYTYCHTLSLHDALPSCAIGEAVGAKCAAFGAHVIGISERTDRPAGFSDMYPKVALHDRLAEADFVVLTAPLSPVTTGIINAAALERMKSSAYLVKDRKSVG